MQGRPNLSAKRVKLPSDCQPLLLLGLPWLFIAFITGMLVTFVKAYCRSGLIVAPPQLTAPELPGRKTVLPVGKPGVKGPAFCSFSSSQIFLQVAFDSAESCVRCSRSTLILPKG